VIRDEMEQTRASLADKLGALETQVRQTVSGATEAVSSTVEGVKEVVSSVTETVESVTETFNVSKQVERNPWMAMGAAVATGFVVAQVISRASAPAAAPATSHPPQPSNGSAHAAPGAPQPAQQGEEHGLMHTLGSIMPDMSGVMNTMVSSLGGLAVGGLMGVIREMAASGLPDAWRGDVTKLIDQVTNQLGGKPLDSAHSHSLLEALGLGGDRSEGAQGAGNGSDGAVARGAPAPGVRTSF